MKERLNEFIDYIKNLNKELKIIYSLFVLGIFLILFGSVKIVFFNNNSTNNESGSSNNNGEENVIVNEMYDMYSKYLDISINSIEYIKNKIKSNEINFIEKDALYLFSVGSGKYIDGDDYKKSPFGNWIYFYVGVTCDDSGAYQYYILSLDDSEQGIDFKEDFELYDEHDSLIVSKSIMTVLDFGEIYSTNGSFMYSKNAEEGYLQASELTGLEELMSYSFKEKVVFVSK